MRSKQSGRPTGIKHRVYLQEVDREGRPMQSHTERLLAGRVKLFREIGHAGRKAPGSLHGQTRRYNPRPAGTVVRPNRGGAE